MQITPDKFEIYEAVILSEQVPQSDVPSLLAENPEFEIWYRKRAADRTAKP